MQRLFSLISLMFFMSLYGCSRAPAPENFSDYMSYHIKQGDTAELRKDLVNDAAEARFAALAVYQNLSVISPETADQLVAIIRGQDSQLASLALAVLAQVDSPNSVDAVEIALDSDSRGLAELGSRFLLGKWKELNKHEERLVPVLRQALEHSDADVRGNVALVLLLWGYEEGSTVLSGFMDKYELDTLTFAETYKQFRLENESGEIQLEDFVDWFQMRRIQ